MRARRAAGPWLALLVVATLLGTGCGKKGAPRPPEPRGPLPPRRVQARQIGDQALIGFEVSRPRGTKPAQKPVRAELIRVSFGPGIVAPADPDAFRRRGDAVGALDGDPFEPGTPRRIGDETLAGLEDGGIGSTLRYAVRVLDRRQRSSPLVVAEDLVMLSTVDAPSGLRAEPTADGIRLTWTAPPGDGPFRYNVYRFAPGEPCPLVPVNPSPLVTGELLDPETVPGRRYNYVARVVLADGRPYREGETSRPITVLSEDRFAPEAPTGLVAVQEGPAVRLFWNPNTERDLAGFRVYRRVGDASFDPIGPDLVGQPLYLDSAVDPGQRLEYWVNAVDRAEIPNESAPSASFEVIVVEEPVQQGRDDP